MKNALSLFLLIQTFNCFSQDFKITVLNTNSDPIPYAYILINNKPVGVSDSLGKAAIPINILHENDTIGVSFLGAFPMKTIYNETLQKDKFYCFILTELEYELDGVTVEYKNYERLFRKTIKTLPLLNYDCLLEAELNVKMLDLDKLTYTGSGSITAINEKSLPRAWNWFNPPIRFIPQSSDVDSNKIWDKLNLHLHWALNHPNLVLWKWQNNKTNKGIYSCLGEKDESIVFRILYPKTWFTGYYYQVILFVDKTTNYIKSVEIEAYNDEGNTYKNMLKLKFDCDRFNSKKHRGTIYLPNNIDYSFETINESQIIISLRNIKLNDKK